ncbi:MAG: hypothetical protein ONB46_10030 [candidate division KSB1 bacterium]|nr:hypothetical protein [candidate division KSB1 bacterium]MDZ7366142.1 hypothetical protein [candidate division KSB1 bacterium]MDZ7404216.1 hypothetical protein [candidate division KSB1 bacterium]
MQRARYWQKILASCLLSLLLVNGCGDRPVQPLGSDKSAMESASGSLGKRGSPKSNNSTSITDKRVKRKEALSLSQSKIASNLITASAGGTVSINELSISIPAGAVSSDKNISINCNDNLYVQADFGPDGTQFNLPATITISYANADITGSTQANLSISWFDPAQGQWVDLGGTVDTKNKTVSVQVWHFTEYTLSMR